MPWIIWRYVLWDVLVHAALGLAAITLLIVLGNVLRFLEDLVGTGVAIPALGQLLLVILPSYLSYSIPTALVFGVLITFGRMSSDGEVLALGSSGISVGQMLVPVLALGAAAAVVSAYLMAEVGPRGYARMKEIARDVGRHAALLDPGEFREVGGRVFFFQSHGGTDCPLRGVVIADFSGEDEDFFVTGVCGELRAGGPEEPLVFHLDGGAIQLAGRAENRFRMLRFEDMEMPLDFSTQITGRRWPREFTTPELIEIESSEARGPEWLRLLWVQVHRRAAFPLASVVLAIVALPLGIRPLRTGRSAGAMTAVAVMGGYWIVFSAGESAAEAGQVPALVGVWFANLLFLALGIALMRRSSGAES